MTFYNVTYSRVTSNSGNGQKTNYGNETVPKINVLRSVCLNGTTVNGKVSAGGNITATDANVGKIEARGNATITDTTCRGNVEARGSITSTNSVVAGLIARDDVMVVNSKISDEVSARGSITANRCEALGHVIARGSVDIGECLEVSSVSGGNHVRLQQSKVQGNVSSNGDVTIVDSTIRGTLSCSSNHLVLEGSTIDTIDLRYSGGGNSSGNTMIISGGSSVVVGEKSYRAVGNGGMIVTDEGVKLISGTNPDDVFINGVSLSQLQSQESSKKEGREDSSKQVLELRNCTVGNIIFEGGNGEVILSEGSPQPRSIKGGKVSGSSEEQSFDNEDLDDFNCVIY